MLSVLRFTDSDSGLLLTRIIRVQHFLVVKWKQSLKMLFVRYHDLANTSVIYLSHMNTYMFPLSLSPFHLFLIHDLPPDICNSNMTSATSMGIALLFRTHEFTPGFLFASFVQYLFFVYSFVDHCAFVFIFLS